MIILFAPGAPRERYFEELAWSKALAANEKNPVIPQDRTLLSPQASDL